MASKEQYAKWCLELIGGEDYFVSELYESLRDDEFIDENDEWDEAAN